MEPIPQEHKVATKVPMAQVALVVTRAQAMLARHLQLVVQAAAAAVARPPAILAVRPRHQRRHQHQRLLPLSPELLSLIRSANDFKFPD
jgi:hypothetical protein